nr:zinc knuckle CX2CX4HX4C [Tanacetum cinerariifolium]
MDTADSLMSSSAFKVENIDGRILGKDGKSMKAYLNVQFEEPITVPRDASTVEILNTPKGCNTVNGNIGKGGADVALSLAAVDEISNQFVNNLYGHFIGKKLAFLIMENYAKNTWAKYGLERVMLHNCFFFFQFSTREGMEQVPENGP